MNDSEQKQPENFLEATPEVEMALDAVPEVAPDVVADLAPGTVVEVEAAPEISPGLEVEIEGEPILPPIVLNEVPMETLGLAPFTPEETNDSVEEAPELSLDEDDEAVVEIPGEKEPAAPKEIVPVVPIDWQSATEAVLLAADKPVSIERLREVFGEESPSAEELEKIFERIAERHQGVQSGITLRKSLGGWQFATRSENAKFVQLFLATKPFRLGRSSLETLSIVAYRQPVTRAEIDQVRGIDSSHLMRVLMERGLVRMAGKADLPGRPVQYATTPKFLETVGLSSLADLPPLSELDSLKGDTPDPIKELEAGLDRFIQETPTQLELSHQTTEGLGEIDALISKAEEAPKEVYGSQEAAEVAKSNEEALLAYQESSKRVRSARRKKTITFDELTGAAPDTAAEEAVSEMEVPSEELTVAECSPEPEALPDVPPPSEEPPPETVL